MRELVVALIQTGSASIAALAFAVLATKIFAVVLGPAGMGLVALIRQIYESAVLVGTLNGQGAIAQGIASRTPDERQDFAATVTWVLLATGGLVALVFLAVPSAICRLVIGRHDPAVVALMRWLAPAILAGTAGAYLLGLLNGHRAIGRLALLQILGGVVAAATAYPVARLLRYGHTEAVALQIALPVFVTGALALVFVLRSGWAPWRSRGRVGGFRLRPAAGFLRLAAAMLFSGGLATATPLVVRALTVRSFGFAGVGIFSVAWNISTNYVLLILSSFSTYYVPSLSRLQDPRDRHELIHRVLRLSLALMVPLIVTTTVLKPAIVRLLYAPTFLPALEIMRWMLVADYFKVTSWVFSYTMVAYADVRTWMWTELAWAALSLGGAVVAVVQFHALQLVAANFVLVYVTYLIFALAYVHSHRYFVLQASVMGQWCLGLGLVLAAAAQTWNDAAVHVAPATIYVIAALYFSWTMLTREERCRIRQRLQAPRRLHDVAPSESL